MRTPAGWMMSHYAASGDTEAFIEAIQRDAIESAAKVCAAKEAEFHDEHTDHGGTAYMYRMLGVSEAHAAILGLLSSRSTTP